jgi:hypothetical protein
MTFLQGLHGGIAVVVLALLLFVDECVVPLPFAPTRCCSSPATCS